MFYTVCVYTIYTVYSVSSKYYVILHILYLKMSDPKIPIFITVLELAFR